MTTSYRVSITNGQSYGPFRDGATGSVADLRAAAKRAGLIAGDAWDDGSVPVYRDAEGRDADTNGDACSMLIRAVAS